MSSWPCHRCDKDFSNIGEAVRHEKECLLHRVGLVPIGVSWLHKTTEKTLTEIEDLKARLAFLSSKSNARWSLEMRKAVDIRVKNWRSK